MITYQLNLRHCDQEDEITVEEMGYTDEEWRKLSQDKQDEIIDKEWIDWSGNYIDGGYVEIKND